MKNRWLLAILTLALTLRMALLYVALFAGDTGGEFLGQILTPDSKGYINLAANLIHKGQFTTDGQPEVFRTPGYPCFLAPWLAMAPWQNSLGLVVAIDVQILLDCLLVFLTYFLGRELFSHRAGLVGALLQAISPLAIAFSCRVLSDSIFALPLTAALLVVTLYFKAIRPPTVTKDNPDSPLRNSTPILKISKTFTATGQTVLIISCGLLLAMACYVRPIGLTMSVAFVTVVFFYRWRWRQAVILAGVLAVCLLPWVWRNASAAGYTGFSDVSGRGLLDYSAADTIAHVKGTTRDQVRQELYADAPAGGASSGEMNAYRMRKAAETFRAYPGTFLKAHLRGDLAFCLPGATEVLEVSGLTTGQRGTLQVLQDRGLLAAIKNYFGGNTAAITVSIPLCLIDVAKAVGLLLLIIFAIKSLGNRSAWSVEVWLMILLVGISFLMPGVASHPRFRLSVEPILNIAAAVGFLLAGQYTTRKKRQLLSISI